MKITQRSFLAVSGVLVALCSTASAQNSATPAYVQSVVAAAQASGTSQPLVPEGTQALGTFRPHVWLGGPLAPQAGPFALPSFCTSTPSPSTAYCPNAIQKAYQLSSIIGANGGAGMTIGIVDAYYYPNVALDLTTFNTDMGLSACTVGNGCLTVVNQTGGAPGGAQNASWVVETMLDVEWAHAMAPNAKILLVETDDNQFTNLGIGVTYALAHSDIVSNSYGTVDFAGANTLDSTYSGSTKPILFSSGDTGTPTSYPCVSPFVTCVGGTSLFLDASFNRTSETGWAGSGGGCSVSEPGQAFQAGFSPASCSTPNKRATPDVAAIADPATGVAVYAQGNYLRVGGTSLSSPLTAALYADIMTARVSFGKAKFGPMNTTLYNAARSNYAYFYFDVTTGNNGLAAGPGYDLVTGLGVSKVPAMANRFFGLIP